MLSEKIPSSDTVVAEGTLRHPIRVANEMPLVPGQLAVPLLLRHSSLAPSQKLFPMHVPHFSYWTWGLPQQFAVRVPKRLNNRIRGTDGPDHETTKLGMRKHRWRLALLQSPIAPECLPWLRDAILKRAALEGFGFGRPDHVSECPTDFWTPDTQFVGPICLKPKAVWR